MEYFLCTRVTEVPFEAILLLLSSRQLDVETVRVPVAWVEMCVCFFSLIAEQIMHLQSVFV